MTQQLAGKVVVVTGGASGIGQAVAQAAVAAGAKVVIAGRDAARGQAALAALSGTAEGAAIFVQTDVQSEAQMQALFAQAVATFGGVDYCFNNAGVDDGSQPLATIAEPLMDQVLDTNIKGTLLGTKHGAPLIAQRGGGAIVNNGSFVGTTAPFPLAVVYGATKAAVISITASTALGYADQGVRTYAVCPYVTDTAMMDRVAAQMSAPKTEIAKLNPSGQLATPADIASVVLAMFAGDAAYKSGESHLVDSGGRTQKIRMLQPEAGVA